jgi:anaerobic magnesium-protoporphyrin IX monomethyl ester cyclase
MKKILLAGINTRHTHSCLSLAYLQAVASTVSGLPVIVRREYDMNQGLESILANVIWEKPDLVGFSVYIWNVSMVLSLSGALKQALPEVRIILGGPEVSFENEAVLRSSPWIDAIIRGEGEATFLEVVTALAGGEENFGVPGVSWRRGDTVVHEPDRPYLKLDDLPSPFLAGVYGVGSGFTYYEASRGCPFSCAYCLSSVLGPLRCLSLPRVLEDLNWFFQSGFSQVRFADRTFNFDGPRARAILEHILRHNTQRKKFHFELKPDLIDEELVALLAAADPELFHLEIGIQSTDSCALAEVGRRQDPEKIVRNLRLLKERTRCHVHLDMLAGMPGETFPAFCKSLNEAFAWGGDTIQVGLVKVLKGTSLRKRVLSGELQCMPSAPYAVVRSKWLSAEEVLQCQEIGRLVEGIFNAGRFRGTLACLTIRCFAGGYSEFFSALGGFWRNSQRVFYSFGPETIFRGLADFLDTLTISPQEKTAIRDVMEHERRLSQKVPSGKQGDAPFPPAKKGENRRLVPGFRCFWYSSDPLALVADPTIPIDRLVPAPVWYSYNPDLSDSPRTLVLAKTRLERFLLAWLGQFDDPQGFSEFWFAFEGEKIHEDDLRNIWELCSNMGVVHIPGVPRKDSPKRGG